MCGGGGQSVTSTSGPPQQFLQAYTDVYNMARGLTGQPYEQYTGPMVAGFSPDQLSAFGTIQNAQGLAQPYYNQAASYYGSSALPISPMSFGSYDPSMLADLGLQYFDYAGDLSAMAAQPIDLMAYDIDPYWNEYTSHVTDALSTLYAQNNAEQFNTARGNAAAIGAFGGDREAVLAAEMARQQKLAQDPTLAQVQQQGFAQAQDEFNKQQALDYQRQVAERQYALGAGQLGLGIGQGMWGEFNTQSAQDMQAQQASAYLQQAAGQGLASLGQLAQNTALSGAQAQLGIGGMEQQLQQQLLNVPYYQFMAQQAYPYQQMGWLSNIATGLGGASGGNASTTYPGPSTLGQIAGLGSVGLGVYGLGSQQGWWGGGSGGLDSGYGGDFGSAWAADGGRIGRAGGGSVGLDVPPEFGGSEVPGGSADAFSYIPGAHGLGSQPANSEGGGLSKMFMQPVTTQTQKQSGGGGLAGLLGLGVKAAGLFLDDGGAAVPRGTGLDGYANGGGPHPAAPIVADLTRIAAPSSFGPVSAQSVMPQMNFAPTVDAQAYPGAMVGVPQGWMNTEPVRIPMANGMFDRAALNPAVAPSEPSLVPLDIGFAEPPALPLVEEIEFGRLGAGDADGGRVGMAGRAEGGGIGAGAPVPMGMPDPAQQLAEKIRRIQELEKLRVEDRFPRFSKLPLGGSARDAGGGVMGGGLSYIPDMPMARPSFGPPKSPVMPGWKPDSGMQSLLDMLKQAKTALAGLGQNEAMGGAVEPSSGGLGFDAGGMVNPQADQQQRALLQQYQNLPVEKLRELAMQYPPTTPQGAALQRALQMKQMMTGGTGPSGPHGPAGLVYPGTTAANGGGMGLASRKDGGSPKDDWIEPPPKDWRKPGDPLGISAPPNGLAVGGDPEDLFGPDMRDVQILFPNDVSGVQEQPMGGLSLPPTNTSSSTGPDGTITNILDTPIPSAAGLGAPRIETGASALRDPSSVSPGMGTGISAPRGTNFQGDAGAAGALVKQHESGGNYNVGYGGVDLSAAPKDENGFPIWEGKTFVDKDGKVKRTHAAGAYQFQPGTWAQYAKRLGIRDFSQQSQDAVFRAAYLDQGFAPWAPYNSKIAAAVGWSGGRPSAPGVGVAGLGSAEVEPLSGSSTSPGLSQSPSAGGFEPRERSDTQQMMSSPWMALIGAGAGMLASRSPYAGVAIGEGIQTGLKLAGSMADRENKEELTNIRSQSAAAQAANLVDKANAMRDRAQETSFHHRQTEAQAAQNAALREQQLNQQAANAAAQLELKTQMANSQEQARQAKAEYDRTMTEIRKQLAETSAAKQKAEESKGEWRYGTGPDPSDPGKQVAGSWFYPKVPDPNAPNRGIVFEPYAGTAKESGAGAGASGRRAMFDQLIKDGLAKDYIDAERKVAEARRNPDTFRNSAVYARLLASEKKALGEAPSTMTLDEGARERMARKRVDERLGIAAGVVGGTTSTPTPPAARPATPGATAAPATKPAEVIQNGWRYQLQPDGSYKPTAPAQ